MTFQLRNPSRVSVATSDTWATPQWVVEWVAKTLGVDGFDFDPCCHPSTAKAPDFISPDRGDGLVDPWRGRRVWVNPPYSNQGDWLRRCAYEARNGRNVAALVMPSFDSAYWRPAVWDTATEIWMLEGRIAFEVDGEPRPGGNVRSCVVVYAAGQRWQYSPSVRYLRPVPPNPPKATR